MKDDYDLSKLVNKKKKRVNSKQKGGTFERKICNILNERFNTKLFARTPGSGAFASTHTLPEHIIVHGDIITPKNFKFSIEIKKGYDRIRLTDMFNPKSEIWSFIQQAKTDAKKAKKEWILIFQQDRCPILLLSEFSFPCKKICYETINIYLLKDILTKEDCIFFV